MDEPFRTFIRQVVAILESLGYDYMVGGSVASIYYGEVRTTQDIDIGIALPLEAIGRFLDAFETIGFYVTPDAMLDAFLYHTPFNVVDTESGYKADFFITPPSGLEQEALARRRRVMYDDAQGTQVSLCSPEDVIVLKLKYFLQGQSEKHLRDIGAMLAVQGEALDTDYIADWAGQLGADEVWRQLLAAHRARVAPTSSPPPPPGRA